MTTEDIDIFWVPSPVPFKRSLGVDKMITHRVNAMPHQMYSGQTGATMQFKTMEMFGDFWRSVSNVCPGAVQQMVGMTMGRGRGVTGSPVPMPLVSIADNTTNVFASPPAASPLLRKLPALSQKANSSPAGQSITSMLKAKGLGSFQDEGKLFERLPPRRDRSRSRSPVPQAEARGKLWQSLNANSASQSVKSDVQAPVSPMKRLRFSDPRLKGPRLSPTPCPPTVANLAARDSAGARGSASSARASMVDLTGTGRRPTGSNPSTAADDDEDGTKIMNKFERSIHKASLLNMFKASTCQSTSGRCAEPSLRAR